MFHVLQLCGVLCSPATCDGAAAHCTMSSGCIDVMVHQLRAQTSDDSFITAEPPVRALLACVTPLFRLFHASGGYHIQENLGCCSVRFLQRSIIVS
jgi:hypothetical protein